MKTVITGRKVNLRDNFKDLAEKKLSKFDKLFDGNASAEVTVTVEKNRQTVEATIRHEGHFYRAESTMLEMNEALDKVVEALAKQFRKHKARLAKRLRKDSLESYLPVYEGAADESAEEKYEIVKVKNFPVKPLDVEEAILQMNMIGHSFFVFSNSENEEEINVVYVRNDGKYGLIVPEK